MAGKLENRRQDARGGPPANVALWGLPAPVVGITLDLMSTAEAVEELAGSHEFLDHLAYLNQVAEDERRRREQFVEELGEDTKAEFINGQIVVHSPVRLVHLDVGFFVTNLLGNFVLQRGLGKVFSEKCFVRCTRNDYEPDVCYFSQEKCAGWANDKLFFPPPDLVVEVLSPSTERNDRTVKLQDYARHGVGEYWIMDGNAKTVEQHTLPPGRNVYELKARLSSGDHLASVVLAGFTVPAAAFFDARENQRALLALLGQD